MRRMFTVLIGICTMLATLTGCDAPTNSTSTAIKVESVQLNKTTLTLEIGESETLLATVSPKEASKKDVTWATSNKVIASVKDGKVVALSEGNTSITATVEGKKSICDLTVIKKLFVAFDGVDIGANSYTYAKKITVTKVNDTSFKLTGEAPIITPWFQPSWNTYNYITFGIRLPEDFSGTHVYASGIMRYDINPKGEFKMAVAGDGTTPLAVQGDALGYFDCSVAANSLNTKKDNIVKLKVIFSEGQEVIYTIDISEIDLKTA